MNLIHRQTDNERFNERERERRICLLQDSLDVAKAELRALPVGTIEWRMKQQQVKRLDEQVRQLRDQGSGNG